MSFARARHRAVLNVAFQVILTSGVMATVACTVFVEIFPGAGVTSRKIPDHWMQGSSLVLSTVICVPIFLAVLFFFSRKHKACAPARILGLRGGRNGPTWTWALAILPLLGLYETINWSSGGPLVDDWMIAIFSSASSRPALFLAVVFLAPVGEELLFRGLLLGGLEGTSSRRRVVAVVLTSLAWSVLHLQYDLRELLFVFVLGLLLGTSRLRTGSIWPAMAMHSVNNAFALLMCWWVLQ